MVVFNHSSDPKAFVIFLCQCSSGVNMEVGLVDNREGCLSPALPFLKLPPLFLVFRSPIFSSLARNLGFLSDI